MIARSEEESILLVKILAAQFSFVLIYAVVYLYFGAWQASLILISTISLGVLSSFLLRKSRVRHASKGLVVLNQLIFIYLISNFCNGTSASEYYYIAVMMLVALLFTDFRRTAITLVGIVLVLWRIQKERLHLIPVLDFTSSVPIDFFYNMNFIGTMGLVMFCLWIFLDRSSRYQSNLEKINERQEHILDGAGLGAWDWWLETNKVHFDRRWCEMLGLDYKKTPQHLSTWQDRVHPDDLEGCFVDIKNYLDGKTPVYENIHRIKHEDGNWVWILDRGRVSERDATGKAVRFTGTHFEVTRYKELETLTEISLEKLKLSQAQLEEAQRVARIGSWSFDVHSQQITWSKQMYSIFNEDPSKGAPSYEKHLSTIHVDDKDYWQSVVHGCIRDAKPYRMRFRTVYSDGKIIWVEAIGKPLFDESGKITGLMGTCQDITDIVNAEEAMKLERSKALLNAKLASLGEMSAGIAHEINNPLAIISGMIYILKSAKSDPEESLRLLDSIQKASDRIARIVLGLRKFSRTSDKATISEHNLNKIIDEAIILLNTRAKQYSVNLTVNADAEYMILCDEIEIEQVLINLVNNGIDAVRYLPHKWVNLTLTSNENEVILRVQDSGPGISPADRKKLFQPFFTTKPSGEGTGLGLSIVKGILQEHDATIELDEKDPHTCFELKFKKLGSSDVVT